MKNTFKSVNLDAARGMISGAIDGGYYTRSAWNRGVIAYAEELLESVETADPEILATDSKLAETLLNGAHDWKQYSYGGCALIYDADIANRLCTPGELRITRNGDRQPNIRETWLDVQARALFQASRLVRDAIRTATTTVIEQVEADHAVNTATA